MSDDHVLRDKHDVPYDVGPSPEVTELRYESAERVLHVSFDDGSSFALPAELLRVESPSAEVQGHGPGQKQTVSGRRFVGIASIEPVGHYAVRLGFDDMHDSGIFSWRYLHEVGTHRDQLWHDYLAALEAKGLSRDPERRRS